MTRIFAISAFTLVVFYMSCKKETKNTGEGIDSTATTMPVKIKTDVFGKLADGQVVNRYTLVNKNNVEMQVINYGGIITTLKVPNKRGVMEDVVLGYDSLSDYVKETPYFGAIVGRYGNRIAKGKFTLDGTTYTLAQNNNGEHLHGGLKGFDKVYWNIEEIEHAEGPALKLMYTSADMEEGYPGNLAVEVEYVLTDKDELKISYTATTDKKTVVNLTQHSYFNLTGNPANDILSHEVMIQSDQFVPVTKSLIPTGELKDVAGTPFDFREPKKIGLQINDKDQQLVRGLGYDHCWVLSSSENIKFAASVYDPTSGRYMEVHTTEPAIQFYSGNFLDGTLTGKKGIVYNQRHGLCLETEHYPDSPNQPKFPSVILNPGETYATTTVYSFSVK